MNEVRDMIVGSVRRLCEQHCSFATVEAAEQGQFPVEFWKHLSAAGILQVLVKEEDGGVGASLADAAAALSVLGSFAAPGPILETMVANLARSAVGLTPVDEPQPLSLIETRGTQDSKVDGKDSLERASFVQWAQQAPSILVARCSGGDTLVAEIASADGNLDRLDCLSDEPVYSVNFPTSAGDWVTSPKFDLFERLTAILALGRCAKSVGAMQWMLDSSLHHVNDRVQFGRPLAKFQAVQQLLAEMAAEVAAADAICNGACESADAADWSFVPAACARIGEAIDRSVAIAHQLHGAIGFSREHGLNFRTRRAMQWRAEGRATGEWRKLLGARFVGKTHSSLWESFVS